MRRVFRSDHVQDLDEISNLMVGLAEEVVDVDVFEVVVVVVVVVDEDLVVVELVLEEDEVEEVFEVVLLVVAVVVTCKLGCSMVSAFPDYASMINAYH